MRFHQMTRALLGSAPRPGRRFTNLDPAHRPNGAAAVLRWGVWDPLTGRRRTAPPGPPAPRVAPDLDRVRDGAGRPRLTWIGHASFLGTLAGASFLVDPVFSRRIGWVYPRHGEPGLAPADLPSLDAVLVSHNHYDHLDEPSILALPPEVPFVAPRGLGAWLRRRGRRATELAWWESVEVGRLRVTLVPARHWSRRRVFDVNRSHWGGFVVEAGGVAVYHAGDSAWFDGFAEIGRRFPDLAAALIPVGGYEPGWFMLKHHMSPEQAGRAFLEVGARRLVPTHWGAFQLTDEPLREPVERLQAWWKAEGPGDGRALDVLAVGETLLL